MKKCVGVLRGDTLIEVLVATGIFSLIAVAVVAIMNNGTLNLQTSLETTITREEIDTQAEALRFIHAGYVAERNQAKNQTAANETDKTLSYTKLWDAIVGLANDDEGVAKYAPQTCDELYEGKAGDKALIESQNAFVINTRKLGEIRAASADVLDSILVTARKNSDLFGEAVVNPRMVFQNDDTLATMRSVNYDDLYQAQGIYVVASTDRKNQKNTTYYDFYIRACWTNSGAGVPSTISTLVRLYNPDYANTTETKTAAS